MKLYRCLLCAVLLAVLPASLLHAQDVTLLMVPRDDAAVRVGIDVGNRHPTILLSYVVLPNGSVSLHGWSGTEWVSVSADAFAEGSFFPQNPGSAMIVEAENIPPPEALVPPEKWCPAVYVITTTELRPLLHLLGRHYDFSYQDWKWFSENYRLPMNSINPEGLNIAWYHRRLNENLKSASAQVNADIEYLKYIRSPQMDLEDAASGPLAEPVEVVTDPESTAVPSESTESGDAAAAIGENPLTNAIPQAVILSPGDADEATGAEAPEEPGNDGQADPAE